MKRSIKYITTLIVCITISVSCKKDLLNPVPQTSVSDASAFSTPQRIINQLLSVYASLKHGNHYGGRFIVYGDIRGEDFINENTNLVTNTDVYLLNATSSSANNVTAFWARAYFTINLANIFIDGLTASGTSVIPAALANNYLGEAKFLRAVCYYSLLQLYARPYADGNGSKPGIPLRLTGLKGSGFSDLARSTVGEVYTQILADLDYAEANLPLDYPAGTNQAVNRTTRAHRNTAIAFKTRVYLSMQKYANVITEANKIVSSSAPFTATTGVPFALQADITNVFKTPYTSTESILSMPMSSTSGDNPGTQNALAFYYYQNAATPGVAEYSLNPVGIIADPNWKATDKRRSFIFTNTATAKKYLSKYTSPNPWTDFVPVIRYSEVLLNLAEALARTNGVDARAVALLNAVRQRSDPTTTFAPATATELINLILNERRIEFLGEGLRNNDLMRLLQTIPAKGAAPSKTPSEDGYIWPMSADELALNRLMTP